MASLVHGQALRDPTLPAGQMMDSAEKSQQSSLVLSSIIKGSENYAVINNHILKVGERIEGLKLVHIGHKDVTFSDGRKLTLFQVITE
ncbi:MSHA biogenesis protein MshK [Shewanella sp. SR44-3]|nr:MSHA biogenesis protein MshK [Shewanella sp. SR44-3]